MIFAQVSGGEVVAVFASAQDEADFPGVVEMQEVDQLYLAFQRKIALIEITSYLNTLVSNANRQVSSLSGRIDTLEFAVETDEATQDEVAELSLRKSQLKLWRQYNLKLGRVSSQEQWPQSPSWPIEPEPYSGAAL